jgi:type I restriction enzyme M protein
LTLDKENTLSNPLHLTEKKTLEHFPIIIGNPPYNYREWSASFDARSDSFHRFEYGIPPKSKGDYAFILHMLSSLDENGRMAVLVPHGVLFRERNELKIRKNLIEANLLDAVIGLPSNLLYETAIPTAVLIFKKNRARKDVLFIDASEEYEKNSRQNVLGSDNIDRISKTYADFKTSAKFSYLASTEDIKNNELNLNISLYVDKYNDPVEDINLDEVWEQVEQEQDKLRKEWLEVSKKISDVLTLLAK